MHELHQEFPTTLAAIAWHSGDFLEFPGASDRINFYGITGYPTAEFDGIEEVIGGYDPTSYPYYLPVFEQRMNTPVNFEIDMEISNVDATDYNVWASFEILEGTNEENLAAFVVLTETDLIVPGETDQVFVARSVWPDATVGHALDFSSQTLHEINTTVTLEDDYIFENCEVVVFLQNMDTKEIYQGTSKMMTEIVGINQTNVAKLEVYPNPANDRVNIKHGSIIENLEIYNQVGQLVKQYKASQKSVNFIVSDFEPGIYFLKVFFHDKVITRKLVIE
nr:T9SS type A sorting domain-containing protein [Bacteroidota bacterium]